MSRLSAGEIVNLMKHGISKTPDTRHDLWKTMNRAGRWLYGAAQVPPYMRTWSWTSRAMSKFLFPAGAYEVDLPFAFSHIHSIWIDGRVQRVRHVTPEEITSYRAAAVSTANIILMAFGVGHDRTAKDRPPRPRAYIYPALSEATTFWASYAAAWRDIYLEDAKQIPDYPDAWEELHLLKCRSMAWHLENQEPCDEDSQIPEELARLVMLDVKGTPESASTHSVAREAGKDPMLDEMRATGVVR